MGTTNIGNRVLAPIPRLGKVADLLQWAKSMTEALQQVGIKPPVVFSPDGSQWQILVSDTGVLTTAKVQ